MIGLVTKIHLQLLHIDIDDNQTRLKWRRSRAIGLETLIPILKHLCDDNQNAPMETLTQEAPAIICFASVILSATVFKRFLLNNKYIWLW